MLRSIVAQTHTTKRCESLEEFFKSPGGSRLTSWTVSLITAAQFLRLDVLRHDAAHGVRRLLLHAVRGMGIGAQGEARVEVPEHAGDRANVHAVLQSGRSEGVSQIVQANMLDARAL